MAARDGAATWTRRALGALARGDVSAGSPERHDPGQHCRDRDRRHGRAFGDGRSSEAEDRACDQDRRCHPLCHVCHGKRIGHVAEADVKGC
jgi:hypothetical protein